MSIHAHGSFAELLQLAVTADSAPDFLVRALRMVLNDLRCEYGVLAEVTWTRDTAAELHILAQTRQGSEDETYDAPILREQTPLPISLSIPAAARHHVVREIPSILVLVQEQPPRQRHRYQAFLFGHPDSGTLLLVVDPGPVAKGLRVSTTSQLLFLVLHTLVRLWQDARLYESADALLKQALSEEDTASNRLLDIFDHLPQGVICIDIHGFLTHISRPAIDMLGLDACTVVPAQTHFSTLLSGHGRSVDQQADRLRSTLRWIFQQRTKPSVDDIPEQFDLHTSDDGLLHVRHVNLRQGVHALILSTSSWRTDLLTGPDTEPIDTNEDTFQSSLIARAQLAEESRLQTEQLLATIARQLLDPVRTLQQSAAKLIMEAELPKPVLLQQLTCINQISSRLAHLVSDAMDYHLVTQATLRPEAVDLEPLLNMTVKEVFTQMVPNSCSTFPLPKVQADPSLLIRAFSHLIQFSWDLRKSDEPLRIRLRFSKEQSTFVLSDNGQGLDMKILQDLFKEPLLEYQPIESPVHRSGRSLAVARKIFDMHGGALEVLSIPGVGTTYYFQLQLVEQHA